MKAKDKTESPYQKLHDQQNERERKKKWHVECPNCKTVYGSNKRVICAIVVCGLCGYDRSKGVTTVKKAGKTVEEPSHD